MKNHINKKIIWGAFILFVIVTLFLMIRSLFLDNELEQKGKVTYAKITDYKLGYRGGIAYIYSFDLDGKRIEGKTTFPELSSSHSFEFLNKSFPVIYLENKPTCNRLLISRISFKESRIQFPDSLKWVIEFEK